MYRDGKDINGCNHLKQEFLLKLNDKGCQTNLNTNCWFYLDYEADARKQGTMLYHLSLLLFCGLLEPKKENHEFIIKITLYCILIRFTGFNVLQNTRSYIE